MLQVVSVLGFRLPFYKTPTLLLSLGLSVRVLWYLILSRPDVIHASSPGAASRLIALVPSVEPGLGSTTAVLRRLRSALRPSTRASLSRQVGASGLCG